ncbi:hypothetical protein KU74_01955 [Pectobacterium brasiliense]|uniref:Type I restriction modification DNA specificity domain-containing protein n=1 Tax=Pectobacterium brasiliense TaxID=180957 RepID=A0A0M2F5L2_9GAMM|nr:restriction endonuclease subunit S [Pectobacterium brasiliense]KGA35261.1 hypothetical protein KU74_01955 [Pectobacterium brasiliense]
MDWKLVKAEDLIEFNPRESIPKGTMTKKVAMEKLQPFSRDISDYEVAPFNGGSKFRNGDTLMARITPCLENGKTAQVNILEDEEVAFGSTEFIVLRAKPEVSDKDFIYYLAISPILRDKAIKSMVGSSGRQRVQQGVVNDTEFFAPPLDEQIEIGRALRALDDKIANNTAINHHLAQMAQAMFKSWFIDFEPFGGKMPDDWQEGTIRDTCSAIYNGGTPRRNEPLFWNGSIPWLTSGEVRQSIITKPENCISEAGLKGSSAKWVPSFSTVVALYGATAGQVSMVATSLTTNQAICALVPKEHHAFYNYLVMQNSVAQLENKAIGSAQQNISKAIVEKTVCLIADPNSIAEFDKLVSPLFNKWIKSLFESAQLANLRDVLLPRLMSGELSVADLGNAK